MAHAAIHSTEKLVLTGARAPFVERGALCVLVPRTSFLGNFRDSALAITSRAASKPSLPSNYFFRGNNVSRVNFLTRHVGASFLLHCSVLALLIYLPRALPAKASPLLSKQLHAERIYYRVPRLDPARMPRLAPAGPGGAPGSGSLKTRPPVLGSTAKHANLMIVSKPAHPDNFRQTIYQPASPPELKIPTELKLPNIVMGHPLEKPKQQFNPSDSKPVQSTRKSTPVEAPAISLNANPASALIPLSKSTSAHPLLPIPAAGGAPIQRSRTSADSGSGEAPSGGEGLLVIGVDPSGPSDQISIPGGNRWGEFSIAPPGGGAAGSPGGDPNGTVGGGSGGEGGGGDGSTGIGSGTGGGGGGASGAPGPVSITGNGRMDGQRGGMLDSALLNSMVYPVSAPALNIRKNSLVVSAGPIGGGGLNVYGALDCGKIYSVFLPMPKKNWSLQYCVKLTKQMPSESRSTVIHLDKPLLPPDADMTHRYDFKRIPVAEEKSHRAIVLKGIIAVDGSVQQLAVYQGVTPEMDEAARLAFSRWQFKPAMRDGIPVEVQILVGIPPLAGADYVNR